MSMERAADLRAAFLWMTFLVAANHGVVTTPLIYATSSLSPSIAYAGNAVFYLANIFSALLLASPILHAVKGPLNCLLLAMGLYCAFIGLFSAASFLGTNAATEGAFYFPGCVCGGLAGSLLWTSQGVLFERAVAMVAAAEDAARPEVSSDLAGSFGYWYLLFEVVAKLSFSALQSLGLAIWVVCLLYLLIGVATCVALPLTAGTALLEIGAAEAGAAPTTPSKLLTTMRLWNDPVIWLLSPTNLAFGFSAAYMNGYFNAQVGRTDLSATVVGYLGAVTCFSGAVFSRVYGWVSARCGKGLVLCLGGASFACIQFFSLHFDCCEGWGWWVLLPYVLQGSGRAVYESTNRAVFADFFPGVLSESAFSNIMVQSGVANALCFMLSTTSFQGRHLSLLCLGVATCVPISYGLVRAMPPRDSGESEPLAKH